MQKLTVKSSGSSTKVTYKKTDFDKAVEELVKKGYFEFMDGIDPEASDVFIAGKLINVKNNIARYIKAIDLVSRLGHYDVVRDIIAAATDCDECYLSKFPPNTTRHLRRPFRRHREDRPPGCERRGPG